MIDVGHLHNEGLHCNKRSFPERFPGATVVKNWLIDRPTLKGFLTDVDVVLSAETFYTSEMAQLAHRYGVKTVLACNPEFLNKRELPDLWVPPTRWMWDTIPNLKTLLPVPIATDRFPVRSLPNTARNFLHVVGRPAHMDRNGTLDLLNALEFVESTVTVTITCQQPGYVSELKPDLRTRKNVTLIVDPGDKPNYWDNYTEGDVLVMPRRFGGLCLPVNEALGAGMPAIMPNIPPNNSWLPQEWLVPAVREGSFMAKQRIDYHRTDPKQLAALMDRFATDTAFYAAAKQRAAELAAELSWETLKPKYLEVLNA